MTYKTLTSLFNNAAQTKAGQFFIRHAGGIACASFVACDIGLIGKDYLLNNRVPNGFEQASGLVWLATDGILWASDRLPWMKIPAGLGFIAGAALLGYSGLGSEGQNWQLFTSSIISAQGLALIGENGLQNLAARQAQGGKSLLKTAFTPLTKYPVITTSIGGILGMVSLGVSALSKGDPGLLYVATLGVLGNLGVLATDNNIKNLDRSNRPAPLSPSPRAA